MKTILYIDGFNLFYSAVKGTPLRWLNPVALIERAFPRNQIIRTKYFTAKVSALASNPDQPIRQAILWRALRTLPNLEIIEGDFRTRKVMAAVVSPPPNFIEVFKTEEKGSDVNLAAHLLMDGFRDRYECAIVVSGDYKRQSDPTCAAFEPVACDVFVTEATFALPVFQLLVPAVYVASLRPFST